MLPSSRTLRRLCCAVVVLLAANVLGGCATWKPQNWNLDSLRDERAVELDHSLTKKRTIVEDPFR